MQTGERRDVDARAFLTWALAILRDAAFPVWVGAFVCILAALALRARRSLDNR